MSPERLRYEIRTFLLDNARVDEEWSITGGLVHAIKATSRAAEIKVRINAIQNPQIIVAKGDSIETRVTKLYISNDAQAAESIDLLVVPDPEVLKVLQGAEIGDIDTIGTLGSITSAVDISDRVLRVLGQVDVIDEAARLLGIIDSITNPVAVTSPAGGLGVDIVKSGNQYDQVGVDMYGASGAAGSTVLVTTGDLPAGLYEVNFFIYSSSQQDRYQLQLRDSADVIKEKMTLGKQLPQHTFRFNAVLNDDVVIKTTTAPTGEIGVLLSWRRLIA